ncbi:putative lipoprotein [Plesiocystis pacifica SIR-1]|uniref:Putative lipoprotein n=1 Tax=Plesiocystis pacifica SIR-1 TaxID=391625 RepID=A6GCX5_9BACT|nr:putative lipoprotein [Plesiocystis pacifica SIR-1]
MFSILAGLSALGCANGPGLQSQGPPQDPVVYVLPGPGEANPGGIVTLDPRAPRVEAMAVAGGKIVATGSAADIQGNYFGAPVIRLPGAVVLPGIIDSHTHARQLGMDALRVDVSECETVACMVERLVAEPAPTGDRWLVGQGWDEGAWANGGYPDRAELDAAFPETPVVLYSRHGFATLANGAALERAAIGARTPNPAGGTILRDPEGRATGVLLAGAQALVRDRVPPPDLAQREAAITAALWRLAAAGVTTIHEAGVGQEDLRAFVSLAERDFDTLQGLSGDLITDPATLSIQLDPSAPGDIDWGLPIRVYTLLDGNDPQLVAEALERGPIVDPRDRLVARGFKVFYDGSLGSRTALLAQPYADDPHNQAHPAERISPRAIEDLAEGALERGFQLAVHSIGDAANATVLDIYQRVLERHGGASAHDHRWRLEHAQVMHERDFQRTARLGVIASMQPSHAVGDSAWAEQRLGPTRVRRAYAWRRFLDADAHLIFSSDLPGEPWTPVETLYFAVNRTRLPTDPGYDPGALPFYGDQAVSLDEALTAMTLEGAFAGFAEGRLGALVPGAWADFIVLDADPWVLRPKQLADLEVLGTYVAGVELRIPPKARLDGPAEDTAAPSQ